MSLESLECPVYLVLGASGGPGYGLARILQHRQVRVTGQVLGVDGGLATVKVCGDGR
jgi:hypothetical protein